MTQSKSQNFCPYCGAPIASPQAHFCGNCGKALPAGMNDIPQMKKEADKISPEVKETPASPVKEDASAATESAPGIPAEPENNPAVQENAEVQKKPAAEAHTESHFPDIAPEGAEPQQPASNPVIKEHTGPLPQPEIPYTPAFKHNKDDGFSDPSFKGMYFSFHGRLNRKRYFWRSVVIAAICIGCMIGAGFVLGIGTAVEDMGFLVIPACLALIIVGIASMVSGVSLMIRRMQDLGWSRGVVYGYAAVSIIWNILNFLLDQDVVEGTDWGMTAGFFVLFSGLFFAVINVIIVCKKGTTGPNQYGPDPLDEAYKNSRRV